MADADRPDDDTQPEGEPGSGDTAWSALYSTKSRLFPKPSGDRIAVKVINHYGDEVMKVFTV